MKLHFLCLVFTFATAFEAVPTITFSPNNIIMGLTKEITLECAIDVEKVSTIKMPLSIKVSLQQSSKNKTRDKIIARVSKTEGLNTVTDGKTKASAELNNTKISFINITIDEPTLENAGLYKCEVTGVDKNDKPVTLKASKQVKITSPTLTILLKEFNKQREKIDELFEVVHNFNEWTRPVLEDIADRLNNIQTNLQSR